MSVDRECREDPTRVAKAAAGSAIAAVVRLKSAVELQGLSAFDGGQRERLLRSLDMMLLGAMTCLESTQAGRPKRMSIFRPPGSEDIRAARADQRQGVGSFHCR